MAYLLDTHVLIWWFLEPKSLHENTQAIISNIKNPIYVSSATTWEMIIKISLGKLKVPPKIFGLITEEHFLELPILIAHTLELAKLPNYHNDPFDRLLIAQAKSENFTLITNDQNIKKYDISWIEAGSHDFSFE